MLTYLAVREVIYHFPALVDPVEVAQFMFGDGLYGAAPRSRSRRVLLTPVSTPVAPVLEQFIRIGVGGELLPVDADQVISLFHIDTVFGKRRAPAFIQFSPA